MSELPDAPLEKCLTYLNCCKDLMAFCLSCRYHNTIGSNPRVSDRIILNGNNHKQIIHRFKEIYASSLSSSDSDTSVTTEELYQRLSDFIPKLDLDLGYNFMSFICRNPVTTPEEMNQRLSDIIEAIDIISNYKLLNFTKSYR